MQKKSQLFYFRMTDFEIPDICCICNKELTPDETTIGFVIDKTWKPEYGYDQESVCRSLDCSWAAGKCETYQGEWIFDQQTKMPRYKILTIDPEYRRIWADDCFCNTSVLCPCTDDFKQGDDPNCCCKKSNQ
jgi:hypothetical protein